MERYSRERVSREHGLGPTASEEKKQHGGSEFLSPRKGLFGLQRLLLSFLFSLPKTSANVHGQLCVPLGLLAAAKHCFLPQVFLDLVQSSVTLLTRLPSTRPR